MIDLNITIDRGTSDPGNSVATVTLTVRVTPGAKRKSVGGVHDGALKVCVNEIAEDGKANAALIKLLAKTLKVSRSSIEIVKGHTSRRKCIVIATDVPDQLSATIRELAVR